MKHRQTGFTMIELIVVIVILGVLAAVALPRFTNVQRDARIAKLSAARGAAVSAAALVHGTALARQGVTQPACAGGGFGANPPLVTAAGGGNLCTENGRIEITRLYPAATLAGIVAAAGIVQVNGTPTAAQLTAENWAATVAGGAINVQVAGGTAVANCGFSYTAPAAVGQAPTFGASVTTGC